VTAAPQQLERAGDAAPRPELDWERDWQGRPKVLPDPSWTLETAPPGWVVDGAMLAERSYTRVTTHAEALQDSSALTRWKGRRILLGASRRPDYVTAAAALTTEDRDRDALDDLAEKCLEAAGPNAADVGTALHGFTERIDRGEELGHVPPEHVPTLEAYRRVVSHLTFVEFECRTVCDRLETAGTPDRIGFCDVPDPDGVVDALRIIDTKTGRVDYSAGKFSTQLAIYAHSDLYHPGTGRRVSLEAAHGAPVSRWGLIVHAPAGSGTAELLWIDLEHGWTGALEAHKVRSWRSGASAGALLRPVFARPPRPATQDGTCRGRKQDGTPCGYRRKTKAEGLASQFCGRHPDQALDLERWLAENPGADPDAGEETLPDRTPSQPSFPPAVAQQQHVEAVQREALDAADRAAAAASAAGLPVAELRTEHVLPNGYVTADVGAVVVASDGTRWVKVRNTPGLEAHGWEREARVLEAGGMDLVRCSRSNLLVSQCACSVHRPDLPTRTLEERAAADDAGDEAAMHEDLPPAQELRSFPQDPLTVPADQQLDGDDSYPDHGPADDAAAAAGLPSRTAGTDPGPAALEGARVVSAVQAQKDAHAERPAQELNAAPGTWAVDPGTEQNGNRRPQSGLQTPEDAAEALAQFRLGIAQQLDAAMSETELELIYQRYATSWSPVLTEVAGRRSVQLQEERRREKPSAALVSALGHAPDTATLSRLFTQYGHTELWNREAAAAADNRWTQLAAQAQL
jgi:hypothetical protein